MQEIGDVGGGDVVRVSALADLCNLVAVMLQRPTAELFAGLGERSLAADVEAILGELGREVPDETRVLLAGVSTKARLDPSFPKEARREHTRLFTHPSHPSIPFQEAEFLWSRQPAAVRTGDAPRNFVNRAALDAERQYRAAGFRQIRPMGVPCDCMYVELEFSATLLTERARCLAEGRAEESVSADSCMREFSRLHFDKWGEAFFATCVAESSCDLYVLAGHLGLVLMEELRWG